MLFLKKNIYLIILIFLILSFILNNLYTDKYIYQNILNSKEYNPSEYYQDNTIVRISGEIKSEGEILVDKYLPKLKDIVILKKTVEMYSWKYIRTKHSSYEKRWSTTYSDNSNFIKMYQNPQPIHELGIFYFYPKIIKLKNIVLTSRNLTANSYSNIKLNNFQKENENNAYYLYIGDSNINEPKIGDIRIKYEVYLSKTPTTILSIVKNNELNFDDNELLYSFYTRKIHNVIFNGNVNNLLHELMKNEINIKKIINVFLSFLLFIPIFKYIIIFFNYFLNLNDKSSRIKIYLILFLLVIPITISITYLLSKIFINFSYYLKEFLGL